MGRKYISLPKISIAPKSTHALGHQPEREGWRKAITREEGLASKKEERGKERRRREDVEADLDLFLG